MIQKQIREFVKTLHLPHQGIVLYLVDTASDVLPKKLKSFPNENAKGRFRFYRELLSTSMGLSSEQVISDASLNRACKIA